MTVIYISGGAERSKTYLNGQSLSKAQMAKLLPSNIRVAKSASNSVNFIVLPPGVMRASDSTLRKAPNVPVLTWPAFTSRYGIRSSSIAPRPRVRVTKRARPVNRARARNSMPRVYSRRGGNTVTPRATLAPGRSSILLL